MPLRIEVIADPTRGPGYGLLVMEGLENVGETISLMVQENQRGDYLTTDGQWQGQNASLTLPLIQGDSGRVMVALGPQLVDCFAALPPSCRLQATLGKQRGVLLLSRDLRPSTARTTAAEAASAPEPPSPPVVETVIVSEAPLRAEERTIILSTDEEDTPSRQNNGSGAGLWIALIVALVILLSLAAGVYWYLTNRATEVLPPQTLSEPIPAPPVATAPTSIATREELNQYLLTNPAATDVKAVGDTLSASGKGDLAMLAWQFSARNGNTAAYGAMATLYDPDTWSAKTSPIPQADAETAAYWYEPAALAGDVTAMRQLGKILITLYPDGRQREKGFEWLAKATEAGDAEAKTLLEKHKP